MLRYVLLGAVCFAALLANKAEAQPVFGALPCWWYGETYKAYYAPKPRGNYVCLPVAKLTACYDSNWQLQRDAFCAKPGKWTYIGRTRSR